MPGEEGRVKATLTMATLTMATLTMAALTMATLTMATLTAHLGQVLRGSRRWLARVLRLRHLEERGGGEHRVEGKRPRGAVGTRARARARARAHCRPRGRGATCRAKAGGHVPAGPVPGGGRPCPVALRAEGAEGAAEGRRRPGTGRGSASRGGARAVETRGGAACLQAGTRDGGRLRSRGSFCLASHLELDNRLLDGLFELDLLLAARERRLRDRLPLLRLRLPWLRRGWRGTVEWRLL